MVKPVHISDDDTPIHNLRDELDRIVTVSADPQILGHANRGPFWSVDEAKSDGEPLAVVKKSLFFGFVFDVVERKVRHRRIAEPFHCRRQLSEGREDLRRLRVRPVSRAEPVNIKGRFF